MSKQADATTKKSRERYAFSPEDFVSVWQTSATPQEAADRLSKMAGKPVPKGILLSRASAYRKKGISLKKMPQQARPKLNVDALNNVSSAA